MSFVFTLKAPLVTIISLFSLMFTTSVQSAEDFGFWEDDTTYSAFNQKKCLKRFSERELSQIVVEGHFTIISILLNLRDKHPDIYEEISEDICLEIYFSNLSKYKDFFRPDYPPFKYVAEKFIQTANQG